MVEKDYKRAERLDKVYKHLFCNYGINSQTAMADYLGVSRTGLSAAFNGNKKNLTDNLFKKICAGFPGVFNLNYLLKGEGELLASTTPPVQEHKTVETDVLKEIKDTTTLFSLAMELIKENEALHRQLKASIAELRSLIDLYGTVPGAKKYETSMESYPSIAAEEKPE